MGKGGGGGADSVGKGGGGGADSVGNGGGPLLVSSNDEIEFTDVDLKCDDFFGLLGGIFGANLFGIGGAEWGKGGADEGIGGAEVTGGADIVGIGGGPE